MPLLHVDVRHVPRLRRLARRVSGSQRLRVGLDWAAPPFGTQGEPALAGCYARQFSTASKCMDIVAEAIEADEELFPQGRFAPWAEAQGLLIFLAAFCRS